YVLCRVCSALRTSRPARLEALQEGLVDLDPRRVLELLHPGPLGVLAPLLNQLPLQLHPGLGKGRLLRGPPLDHPEQVEPVLALHQLGVLLHGELEGPLLEDRRHPAPGEEPEIAADLGIRREAVAPREIAEGFARPQAATEALCLIE